MNYSWRRKKSSWNLLTSVLKTKAGDKKDCCCGQRRRGIREQQTCVFVVRNPLGSFRHSNQLFLPQRKALNSFSMVLQPTWREWQESLELIMELLQEAAGVAAPTSCKQPLHSKASRTHAHTRGKTRNNKLLTLGKRGQGTVCAITNWTFPKHPT